MRKATKSSVADARFNDIIAVEAILPAPSKLLAREDFVRAIGLAWHQAQSRFIEIGRYLNQAKDRLQHGEFMEMVAGELPFAHQTANKLMSVARLVDSGAVDPAILPQSSETCYLITTLTEEERQIAVTEGVIRPDVKRQDVMSFKRRIRPPSPPTLLDRRSQLLERRSKLIEELAQIDAELESLP